MAARFAARLGRALSLTREDWRFIAIAVKELALARLRHATTRIDVIFHDLRQSPPDPVKECAQLGLADLRRLWATTSRSHSQTRWPLAEGYTVVFRIGSIRCAQRMIKIVHLSRGDPTKRRCEPGAVEKRRKAAGLVASWHSGYSRSRA